MHSSSGINDKVCTVTAWTPRTHNDDRVILPLKKILLPENIISQPIPTLSDRQFVLQKASLTSAEEKLQRELFWYREELFKCVSGRWQEVRFIRFINCNCN